MDLYFTNFQSFIFPSKKHNSCRGRRKAEKEKPPIDTHQSSSSSTLEIPHHEPRQYGIYPTTCHCQVQHCTHYSRNPNHPMRTCPSYRMRELARVVRRLYPLPTINCSIIPDPISRTNNGLHGLAEVLDSVQYWCWCWCGVKPRMDWDSVCVLHRRYMGWGKVGVGTRGDGW
jgi:hypothetical protein